MSDLDVSGGASVLFSGRMVDDSEISLDGPTRASAEANHETSDPHDGGHTNTGSDGAGPLRNGLSHRETSDRVIDFLQDDRKEMTYARRIALSLMSKSWYYPKVEETDDRNNEEAVEGSRMEQADGFIKPQAPSLEKAWAYFEHVALSRYILKPKEQSDKNICVRAARKMCNVGNKTMDRAEPGERKVPTRLYSPLWTPHSQLGDFGLGIGLYFSTLRAIVVITLIAGLINLPNILYFASDEYSSVPVSEESLPAAVEGSAICLDRTWVPCPDCDCGTDEWEDNRCGTAVSATGQSLTFVLRNNCEITERIGVVNYATMILVFISTLFLAEYLRRQEIAFDEDEQTAQDYSVVVENPPEDATDPDEWKEFFKSKLDANVIVCTIAVDNDLLVRTLVERRELLRRMENTLGPGTPMNVLNLARIAAEQERERGGFSKFLSIFIGGIPEQFARLSALNAKVQGLAQLGYPATRVFLVFETEADQRKVLTNLSVGSLKSSRNDKTALKDPKYLFRGEKVLSVAEPDEPNTIRWQDLNAGFLAKVKQMSLTYFCTLCAIVAVAFLVAVADRASTVGAAFAISGANVIFPLFAKLLTSFEAHASESSKQTSLYFKIAAFRWVNTAFVISIITPFTDTLRGNNGMITQIYALFFAEIVTTNGIQLLDPLGHLNRHVLAPRANTQDAMNLFFQGEVFELAERYTNMTKILFLALWYCAIFPSAFFLCSIALFINYYTDRFSLMRTWKRPPQLGTSLSKFSRRYFFSLACVAMAVVSSYYWSGFPYDNLCDTETPVPAEYVGEFTVDPLDESRAVNVSVGAADVVYRYCNQNFIDPGQRDGANFPFVASNQPPEDEWMSSEQETITTIFGWSALGIAIVVLILFLSGFVESFLDLFRSSYSAVGDDMGIPYTEVPSVSAYIPQVESTMFAYPLLAADSDTIDEELYDWNDPDRPFSFYDLTKDADHLLKGQDMSSKVGFSRVKHWMPSSSSSLPPPTSSALSSSYSDVKPMDIYDEPDIALN